MMKILTSEQIRAADQYTIQNEPISSLDLMERASEQFVRKFLELNHEKRPVRIFCGVGNNGGDGLVIGRLLKEKGWEVFLYIVGNPRKGSEDFKANLERSGLYAIVEGVEDLPHINEQDIIIDGLFGSGLSRPLQGFYEEVIVYLNNQACQKFSIDIASGLFADRALPQGAIAFKPHHTISFQVPKLAFFLPACYPYVGEWHVVDIGLDPFFIEKQQTAFYLTELGDVAHLFPKREKFAHKNAVGRLLIVAGSKGKMGAAVLCARAAFRMGVGLVNVCTPRCGTTILQTAVPEAMVMEDKGSNYVCHIPNVSDVSVIGPGLDIQPKTIAALEQYLRRIKMPIVLDADGINILAKKKEMIKLLPKGSILTPHPGEFKRLVGEWENDFDRLEKIQSFCQEYELNVVLKGAFSSVCDQMGRVHFNPTGNPGLATAGSGDVLAGMVGALLAQGLAPFHALQLGVYLHGLAGDEVIREMKISWLQASDIIAFLPKAIQSVMNRCL